MNARAPIPPDGAAPRADYFIPEQAVPVQELSA